MRRRSISVLGLRVLRLFEILHPMGAGERAASLAGLARAPRREWVAERLRVLRESRSSSCRGCARYSAPLAWVCREPAGRLCGARSPAERKAASREYGADLASAFAKAIGQHDEAAVAPSWLAAEQVQKALPPQLGQAVQV